MVNKKDNCKDCCFLMKNGKCDVREDKVDPKDCVYYEALEDIKNEVQE